MFFVFLEISGGLMQEDLQLAEMDRKILSSEQIMVDREMLKMQRCTSTHCKSLLIHENSWNFAVRL